MGGGNGAGEAWTAGAEALWQPRNHGSAEAFAVLGAGAASAQPRRSGSVGSAGVYEQGKGAGGVAREPERSRAASVWKDPGKRSVG